MLPFMEKIKEIENQRVGLKDEIVNKYHQARFSFFKNS